MSRRTSLPGAAELFRTTSAAIEPAPPPPAPHPGVGAGPAFRDLGVEPAAAQDNPSATRIAAPNGAPMRTTHRIRTLSDAGPTGRERHEEKITVYCSPAELLDLESARLQLRAEHGLAIDRGRIVREAIAVVLADLHAKGDASILVRRLRER